MNHRFIAFLSVGLASCAPLLDADFDQLDANNIEEGPVNLPGPPNGDRMIIADSATLPLLSDQFGEQSLFIFQDPIVGQQTTNHGSVFFDPLPASAGEPIFFSWRGEIGGFESPTGPPVIAAKLQDLVGEDQPNLFSKFTIRFASGSITVQPHDGIESTVGFGLEGPHSVILRIDPDGRYSLSFTGDGVSPGGGFNHEGMIGTEIDPENIGMTIAFDDSVAGGGGQFYRIENFTISQREN